jgi:LmbE family N-acetylglucosaminyl deacetylase
MLERSLSSVDYPSGRLTLIAGQKMLCLAPHPDDEVLGCGGLLSMASNQGLRVHTVIVTDGDQGLGKPIVSENNPRLNESVNAALVLGLSEPEFWHWPDRQIRYNTPLIASILNALRQHTPDWVLLPALTEPHPDHQALALAGMAALVESALDCELLFYEAGAPLSPNTLFDFTATCERKWSALECFVSQEELHPYKRHAMAMATMRALGMGNNVKAAEGFWQTNAKELRRQGALSAMCVWPLQRQVKGLAVLPDQIPLVSIIVRSMDRPSLAAAIASVVAQTYSHIEVVIVNATGRQHSEVFFPAHRISLRLVAPDAGAGVGLGRPQAANLGLAQAGGTLAMFLDDDDLIDVGHIEHLVEALGKHASCVAAYAGVRVLDGQGRLLRHYDTPWATERLNGINFLPIHSVLFRLDVVRNAHLAFDTDLPVLEDWDFWCQLARQGAFVHVPGVSATYCQSQGPESSQLANSNHPHYWALWHQRVLQKHGQRYGADAHVAALAWYAFAFDQLEQKTLSTRERVEALENENVRLAQHGNELARQNGRLSEDMDGLTRQNVSLKEGAVELAKQNQQLSESVQQLQGNLNVVMQSRIVRWVQTAHRFISGR